jgi:hypothetical protein
MYSLYRQKKLLSASIEPDRKPNPRKTEKLATRARSRKEFLVDQI